MEIKITTHTDVPGFNGDFATIQVESEQDITMKLCRNIVAMELCKKAFHTGQEQRSGMWTATPTKPSE